MRRELVIAVAAATIVAGCSGCDHVSGPSSSPESSTAATTSAGSATASSSAGAAPGSFKVTVGGQPQNVGGPVVCSTTSGKFSIAIGDVISGVIVGLEPDASVVHTVGLGTVNGVVMSFIEGVPGQNATATKTGNSYHVTGTAGGVDNAGQQVYQPFEVDATCP